MAKITLALAGVVGSEEEVVVVVEDPLPTFTSAVCKPMCIGQFELNRRKTEINAKVQISAWRMSIVLSLHSSQRLVVSNKLTSDLSARHGRVGLQFIVNSMRKIISKKKKKRTRITTAWLRACACPESTRHSTSKNLWITFILFAPQHNTR
jgi:hypothetical protein